ncbi:MAG: carbohydrate kinase family protein [Marinilabiliaceae bacterium]|nr:carbohydrate kinase family protein [Marinilabiliaceae bacterium]
MNQQFDIVVAGDFNIDLLFNGFPHIPAVGEEVIASDFQMVLGSSAAITATHLAALGAKVAFVGAMGADEMGEKLLTFLKSANVCTDFVKIKKGMQTGCTVVMNQADDRANLTYAGAMETLCKDDFPYATIAKTPYFHLSNPFVLPELRNSLTSLFRNIKSLGAKTSLVPQWDVTGKWDLDFENLLPHLDYFFPNREELMRFTKKDNVEATLSEMSSVLKHQLVMTNGREGALLRSPEKQMNQSGYVNSNPVDCVGAGDAFAAGYLVAKMEGKSDEKALEMACESGALSTFCYGGNPFCENRSDFNEKVFKLLK